MTPPLTESRATGGATAQQQQHLGKTAKALPAVANQQQGPMPSRDAPVSPIPLGALVRFQRHIERVDDGWHRGHSWQVTEDAPGCGIFIGYRYKQNGVWESEDEGYGRSRYWSERGARVKVALVVMDAWRSPYTVDPNGLEVIAAHTAVQS